MARVKRYIDADVLSEAKRRLHHIHDIFDSVVVMFSGGKDSLATLHLTREVRDERGITAPVDVVFRDEELIPDVVIDFVDRYRREPWINMVWFAVPLHSTKYILGVCHSYIQWDPARAWVRPKPAWSETLAGDDRVFDQYSMDGFTAERYRGKVAFITGIRASESIMRFRSAVNKLNENYITGTGSADARRVQLCKPIFDWSENDVFRYFYDRDIRYCPIYDLQLWNDSSLRVSTPLHAESAKKFDRIRAQTPEFYERLIAIFPEMLAHERYYGELDLAGVRERYGQSYEGVLAWIHENIDDEANLEKALARYKSVMHRAVQFPDVYPPRYLLTAFMSGAYKREILPQSKAAR